MFCKYCGTRCDDGAMFCPKCGASAEITQYPVPHLTRRSKNKVLLTAIVGGIVVIAALIVVLLVVFPGGNDDNVHDDLPSTTGGETLTKARWFMDAMISGNSASIFDLFHDDTVDIVVESLGYDSKEDAIAGLDKRWAEWLDILASESESFELSYGYGYDSIELHNADKWENLIEFYEEEFGLEVKDIEVFEMELSLTIDYGDSTIEDRDDVPIVLVRLDSGWFIDVVEAYNAFSRFW